MCYDSLVLFDRRKTRFSAKNLVLLLGYITVTSFGIKGNAITVFCITSLRNP